MLQVENLSAGYGKIEALHGLSFQVERGEIVTLIGANGAGKSSVLKTLMRLAPPEAPSVYQGDILFAGQSILQFKPHKVVEHLKMTMAPEGRRIFGNLTVMENLNLAAWTRRRNEVKTSLERIFDLFPRLAERSGQQSDTLSGGEQQMLAVGRALMTGCSVLLLDEPSMGLAPFLMYDMFRTLKRLNQEAGLTIVVVEQNANMALAVADRGYILDGGKIVAQGPAQDLLRRAHIKEVYLGG
jgi:branched-chain amino acid transport system ATP-binding protein